MTQNVPHAGTGGGGGNGGTTSSTPGDGGGNSGGGSVLYQKVIDSFYRSQLGEENLFDNDEDMDGCEY